MKQQPEYRWLYNVSCDVAKQAIKDVVGAYKNFFKNKLIIQSLSQKRIVNNLFIKIILK